MSTKNERERKAPTYWKNQAKPEEGKEFKDPLFPPTSNSLLGLDSSGKPIDSKAYSEKSGNIKTNEIGFFRAKEIFQNDYNLFSDKIEMGDVQQGSLGDCYFLSSVASLCKFPNLIKRMFRQSAKNEDGFYEITLYIDGKRQIIIVDDYLPAFKKNKKPCYAQSNKNEIWVMLLEKAWAKVNGGYANIISGLPCEAMEFLTGVGSLIYDLENLDTQDVEDYKYEIIKNVQLADENNSLITCSTKADSNIKRVGLVEGHAYTLVSFNKITTSQGKDVYLFRIRNPWSQGEWTGDWSDKSKLWDSKAKSQVNFDNKDDGIFFMNDSDFFKYFTHVEICYMLFDSESVIYEVEGKENLKNACVFNVETEGQGFLSVSVCRESWRANRALRDKILPTHISIVQYDPAAKSRLKTFKSYNGTFESFRTCTLNERVAKGNYLVYIFRDFDHAGYQPEKKMEIRITCSAKFKHAQMSYDERDKGFPLLQNIILQAKFKESNFDPDSGEDFNTNGNQLRGNGIGFIIYYISTPGHYIDFTGGTAKVKNYIMLTPYLDPNTTTFHRAIPSGKYLIFLGLMSGAYGAYSFNCFTKAYTTTKRLKSEYDNNDIDLTLYTDFNNDIKNTNYKERRTQSLERAQKEFYGEITNAKVQYKSLSELQKEYGQQLKLLDDLGVETNNNLRWGIIKGEYVIYIGQFNGDKKEGKGLLINPNNIFAGQFQNDQQNGKGYTYNKNLEKLFYCIYENGQRKGRPVKAEQELEEIEKAKQKAEEEMKKEQERLKKIEEEKEALLKKQEDEKRKKEEELALALKKAEEEEEKRKAQIEEELRKAEEALALKRKEEEEERQKEIQRQKEELERIAREEQENIAKAKAQAEQIRLEQEKAAKEMLEKAEELRKLEEERIKQEMQNIENEVTEEANKKKEELKEKEEQIKKEAQQKKEEAQRQMEEAKAKAEQKAQELADEAKKKYEEEKKKAEEAKQLAEEKARQLKEEAEKQAEEAKRKAQEMKEAAEQKALKLKEEAEKKAQEASQQVEDIKNQIQKTKDDAKKLADDLVKNAEERRRYMEERRRIDEERRKQQMAMLQQDTHGQFGIQLVIPDYIKRKPQKNINDDKYRLEHEVMEMCTSCGCYIF